MGDVEQARNSKRNKNIGNKSHQNKGLFGPDVSTQNIILEYEEYFLKLAVNIEKWRTIIVKTIISELQ